MPKYAPGTLVRVKDSAWDNPSYRHGDANRRMVERHGYLWIVDYHEGEIYGCRSLATGSDEGVWLHSEIEGASDG